LGERAEDLTKDKQDSKIKKRKGQGCTIDLDSKKEKKSCLSVPCSIEGSDLVFPSGTSKVHHQACVLSHLFVENSLIPEHNHDTVSSRQKEKEKEKIP
jgi:hypothetical protein